MESAFLGTFVVAYLFYIGKSPTGPTPGQVLAFPLVNTLCLLASSVTMEIARRHGRRWLIATMVLGGVFLVGQVLAWTELSARGFYLASNPHAAFVYLLSAVHGVHLLAGVVALIYAARHPLVYRLCAIFWHFVGAVWVYVMVLLLIL